MKKTFLTVLGLLVLLSGCSWKNSLLSSDSLYEESLTNTKKGAIVSSLETKAIIIATYLNNIAQEYADSHKEVFLASVYIDKDFSSKKKKGLYNIFYNLTLNGSEKPLSIKKLDKDDALLQMIPIVNSWSDYYLVEFKESNKDNLTLTFKNKSYGKTELKFLKGE